MKNLENKYGVSSLKDKSIYFFELYEQRETVKLDRLEVSERGGDLRVNKNKLYLFLEDTDSIGINDLN